MIPLVGMGYLLRICYLLRGKSNIKGGLRDLQSSFLFFQNIVNRDLFFVQQWFTNFQYYTANFMHKCSKENRYNNYRQYVQA